MAVQVPILAISAALKMMQLQTEVRSAAQQREAQREFVRLRLEAEDRRHQREAQTLIELANIAENLNRTKAEAILRVFEGVKDVLLSHQNVLAQEKAALSQADLMGDLSGPQFVLRQKRQRELDRELADVSAAAMQLGETAFALINQTGENLDRATHDKIKALGAINDELS